jgi:hypothetical protein
MALRRQVPEPLATWEDPIMGVNLFDSEEDLKPGEARLMQNCVYRSGVRMRNGNSLITPSAIASGFKVRGGHRYYYGGATPTKKRLIAYSTKISTVSDAGVEAVLTSGMTSNKDTYFRTWTITDKVYISNNTDVLRSYDGTTFATVTGTAIPTPRARVCPILDRLFAITSNGIERTDPRVDDVWSSDSSWATFRPSQVGLFTAMHPMTMRGTDTFYSGAFAFQANAYYIITGTDFGSDVTSATASNGEDSAIQLLDPLVGTSSPDSIVTVPGIGTLWFTTDLNVYWVPEGQLHGQYVGDKLRSSGSTIGIESTNKDQLAQVWMEYYDRYLILGVPTGSNNYADTQFWLDLYEFSRADKTKQPTAIWYGPMTGQTVGRIWREDQQGELTLKGGEGNSDTGIFVYEMDDPSSFTDYVGTTGTDITMTYQSYFKDFSAFSREKYIRSLNFELKNFSGTPTVDLLDLDGEIISDVAIEEVS